MSERQRSRRTILHFGTDRMLLVLRAWVLNEMGYRVLTCCTELEALKLASNRRVDAVLIDLDHSRPEVALLAKGVKQNRPQVPVVVLTDGTAHADGLHEVADALVPKRDDLETAVKVLEQVIDGHAADMAE